MKMYILVKDDIPVGNAIVAVAHASLIAYLEWFDDRDVQEWMEVSFKKVVCKVDKSEYLRASFLKDHRVITESTLGNQEVAMVFKPRKEWDPFFKELKLYK